MTIDAGVDFQDDYWNDNDADSTRSKVETAASKVAERLGSDYETFFERFEDRHPTTKEGARIEVYNATFATAVWWTGENNAFAKQFVDMFNEELDNVGSDVQFAEVDNPYAYEGEGGNSGFDLRIGSFLLLLQAVGGQITSETSTDLLFYFTRAGLLPGVYWAFQYLYWMIIGSITIGVTAIFGVVMDKQIEVGPYFIAAWFHIAFAIWISSMFK
eukprot:CAMPEP_0204639814 /NCGR_PEP_ID=MMETSP0717-20131115/44489_1 /ASSEMBLY_ACC=CAM_ASM_000666 /TAXON_ID=230516 /ORGANISM="Chaetoceros curvisetus" /LENGTH=214 /DNA_ID=CAMNT_0051660031 /DNA_START=18 /DNA_END=659 /DNA_ORIENTATION=+